MSCDRSGRAPAARHAWFVRFLSVSASALACSTASAPVRAQSEARIEIRSGALFKIPAHIEDFQYDGVSPIRFSTGESPEEVLVSDLTKADFFAITRGGAPVGNPPVSLPPPQGTRAIVSATIRIRDGRTTLAGNLRDATTGNRIFANEYPMGGPPDRRSMHVFADEIVLYLTGEQGVAQTRIAFVRNWGRSRELAVIDYDGSNERQLYHPMTIVLSPAWAPGGDRIAFTSFGEGEAAVVGLNLQSGKTWRISPRTGMSSSPRWSPDGKAIAYGRSTDGNTEICVGDPNGGAVTQLTFNPGIDTAPCFSPDGSRITFTSDRSGTPQVYVMDRDGSNVVRITFVGKESDSPDWSPKGDLIAFVCMFDDVYDICTMHPDGSDPNRLTAGEGANENPRWAPDGRHLVYSNLRGGDRHICIMAVDGSGKRVLTGGKGDQYNPAWSPSAVREPEQGSP